MLVLNRHTNEKVIIQAGDDRIELTILGVQGDKVRLGFTDA